MKQHARPILVTGTHRSGTTWVGKTLAKAPGVAYVFEPFNVGISTSVYTGKLDNWYQYICSENASEYRKAMDDLMDFTYPLLNNLGRLKRIDDLARIARDQILYLGYAHRHYRPMLKDPIAFFSSGWLAETYGTQVLVMIRHPAAFCSSLKYKNWQFDFNNFLRQPLLMARHLEPYRSEIEHFSKNTMNVIDQGILLWNCIHHTIDLYKKEHPDWLFIRHEDISINPIDEFRAIFKVLNLDFTDSVIEHIRITSADSNPVEQQPDNQFIRNSKLNVKNWMNRLTPEERSYIKIKTSDISRHFYDDQDWQQ